MLIRCKHQQNDQINSFQSTNSRQFIDENQTNIKRFTCSWLFRFHFQFVSLSNTPCENYFHKIVRFSIHIFCTIEKSRKQKKNSTQSTNVFRTKNDSRLVTGSNKIISQIQTSSLAKEHHRQNSSFPQYSTIAALHRTFSLLTVLVLINNMISLQWSFDT